MRVFPPFLIPIHLWSPSRASMYYPILAKHMINSCAKNIYRLQLEALNYPLCEIGDAVRRQKTMFLQRNNHSSSIMGPSIQPENPQFARLNAIVTEMRLDCHYTTDQLRSKQ